MMTNSKQQMYKFINDGGLSREAKNFHVVGTHEKMNTKTNLLKNLQ